MSDILSPFRAFLRDVDAAPNESSRRHLFTILATSGFGEEFATQLSLGAEYRVNFAEKGLFRRGAIDSFFENLVIEFEANLELTRKHALDQLRGYVAGAWVEEESSARPYLA